MKKSLAIFLSVLLFCISLAPMSFALYDASPVTTKLIEGKYDSAANSVEATTDKTFTLIVSTKKAVKKLTDVSLYLEFDPEVLEVVAAGEAGVSDSEGNITPNIAGFSAYDMRAGVNNQYAYGWVSGEGVDVKAGTDFFYVTFIVIDSTRTATAVAVYLDAFKSDDGDKGEGSNDVVKTTLALNPTINFAFPRDAMDPTRPSTTASAGASAADINTLLQLIRDMLAGKGVTFMDFADAITNILGNSELTMMVEQLVDSDVDISDAFRSILKSLGIDFDKLLEILNKIIDFFKNLFGKNEPGSTAVNTTAAGSNSGSESTGDAGIAASVAVCLLGSAAFVMTRKKKETV